MFRKDEENLITQNLGKIGLLPKESMEKNRIEINQITVGDVVTQIRRVSERLTEDNASRLLLRLANRLDDYAHIASSEPWRSELEFMSMSFGVSGSALRGEMKDVSLDAKKAEIESLKSIMVRLSEHVARQDWDKVHYSLRDLYSTAHRLEYDL